MKILEAIYHDEVYISLSQWKQKYKNIKLEWDLIYIETKIRFMQESDKKTKLLEAIRVFKNHNLTPPH